MLAARGQTQLFGSVRAKPQHPARQPAGVNGLARARGPVHDFDIRVARIFLIEAAKGGLKPLRIDA